MPLNIAFKREVATEYLVFKERLPLNIAEYLVFKREVATEYLVFRREVALRERLH